VCETLASFQAKTRVTKLLDCSLIQANQNGAQASIRERPGRHDASCLKMADRQTMLAAVIDLNIHEVQILIHDNIRIEHQTVYSLLR